MPKCQVDIPQALHRRARIMAVRKGLTLRKMLLLGLEQQSKAKA